jgi:phosphomethylpyrimidine synthase
MHSILHDCQVGDVIGLAEVVQAERMTSEVLSRTIVAGKTIFLKDAKRNYASLAIGQGTTAKINVNIGTPGQRCDPAMKMEKL